MRIDRRQATEAFNAYVRTYDPANPRIALKIAHTWRVAALCERIAKSIPLDTDLAWLCGLLHDIGRFEQVRRFDTFNDAASVPHAALGVSVLFDEDETHDTAPLLRSFVADDTQDALIRTAIAVHSDFRIPQNLDELTRAFCNVLRDADKIDIIQVNCTCPIEDVYGVAEEDMIASELSPTVVDAFYEHRTIARQVRVFPADILVSHLCFAWELVYPASRTILGEQGYINQMLGKHFSNPDTEATFRAMASHMREELDL